MNEEELKTELINKESLYGGLVKNVKRRKVSPNDPRSSEEIKRGGMSGGDRMAGPASRRRHGYGANYAKFLKKFLNNEEQEHVIVEVGVLMGSGLATWSDLFPNNLVYGLDIDLSHVKDNMEFLKSKGAFRNNNLSLHEYDQFEDIDKNRALLSEILQGRKIKVMIDDALHSDETILSTLQSVKSFLADDFVYFIEDNRTAADKLALLHPNFEVFYQKKLTVLTPRF